MAQIPHVEPGEVIRSSLINELIDQLNALGGGTVPTGIAVPDLFGRTLAQARALLMQPSVNLALGTTIDAFGAVVDPNAPSSAVRIVIGQSPTPGTRVPAGSPVSLVLAAQASTPAPAPAPSITGTETVTAAPSTSFRVGETMVIVGTNFNATASLNTVSFDGTPAASVAADPADPTRRLLVGVPTGIPGGPVNPGDADKPGVVVSVSTAGSSTPATTNITVQAPSGVPQPQITNFTPGAQFVGAAVTVNGQNFSNVLSRNIVTLAGVNATVTSASTAQVVFTVPDFADLSGVSGSTKLVQITITVNDGGGNPIGSAVAAGNLTVVRP